MRTFDDIKKKIYIQIECITSCLKVLRISQLVLKYWLFLVKLYKIFKFLAKLYKIFSVLANLYKNLLYSQKFNIWRKIYYLHKNLLFAQKYSICTKI